MCSSDLACPVRKACLAAAIEAEGRAKPGAREGMWGGLDPFERAAVARKTGARSHKSRRLPIRHGTPGGAEAHRRRGEKACTACANAERTYRRDLAATKRIAS